MFFQSDLIGSSRKIMEDELYTQLDHSNRIPTLNDGIAPQALSESLLQSTFSHLNPHLDRITGLPIFSSSFKDFLFEPNDPNNDASTSVISLQQEVPSEVFAYDYSSSVPTSLMSSGLNGLLCDHASGNKWDHNKFLSQPELNCGTSTSGFEPISVFSESQNANDQWVSPNYMTMGSSHPYYDRPSSHYELSLDLVTSRPSQSQPRSGLERGSNSRSPKFSTIISGSSYLGVLHQILSEIARYSLESIEQKSYFTSLVSSNHFVDRGISFDGRDECFEDDGSFEARAESSYRRLELESKKSQLLGLLQMLDDRYNQCLDEIHSKTSALHAAAELDPEVHSSYALRTVSSFYKNLRERISKQILAMGVDRGSTRDKERSFEKCFIQKQWALQQLKRRDQQLWRPQRGLPERSVSVLRAWMFDNFLHPYPKDSEKHLLAIKSGLTRSQVSNWFINARVRLWKPLVEEMSAELNRRKGCGQNEEGTNKNAGEQNHQNQLSIYNNYKQRSST